MKKQLLEKYWKGETTIEEEQWLRNNISQTDQELTKKERRYFEQLNAFVELSPEESFDISMFDEALENKPKVVKLPFYKSIRKMAAIALAVFALGLGTYYMIPSDEIPLAVVEQEEEDPQKAFEIAKASLLLISQKMNKGTDHVNALQKFDLTHDKINGKSKTK